MYRINCQQFFLDGRLHSSKDVATDLPTALTAHNELTRLREKVAAEEASESRAIKKFTTDIFSDCFEVNFGDSPMDGVWRKYKIRKVE